MFNHDHQAARERKPGTVIVKKPTIRNSAIKVRILSSKSRIFSRESAALFAVPARQTVLFSYQNP
jgi:hypothetical protein